MQKPPGRGTVPVPVASPARSGPAPLWPTDRKKIRNLVPEIGACLAPGWTVPPARNRGSGSMAEMRGGLGKPDASQNIPADPIAPVRKTDGPTSDFPQCMGRFLIFLHWPAVLVKRKFRRNRSKEAAGSRASDDVTFPSMSPGEGRSALDSVNRCPGIWSFLRLDVLIWGKLNLRRKRSEMRDGGEPGALRSAATWPGILKSARPGRPKWRAPTGGHLPGRRGTGNVPPPS